MKKILLLVVLATLSLSLFGAVQNQTPVNAEAGESQIDGLIGRWNFNDTADSLAEDSSSNDNAGTLNNTSPENYVTDISAVCSDSNVNALSLNQGGQGDEQFVEVGNLDDLRPDSITVAAWINSNDNEHFGQIAGASGFTKGAVGYSLYYSANYNFLEFAHSNGYVTVEAIDENSVEGQWAHVAATYDAATGDTKLYLNGTLVDSDDREPAPLQHDADFIENAPYDFEIGRAQAVDNATMGFFEGLIDDVRVYNRALDDTEIASLSNESDCNKEVPDTTDLNGDSIPDSDQPNVGGYVSSLTGKTIAIDVGGDCELTTDDLTQENKLAVQDPAFDYVNGLWAWEADCVNGTTTIKLYYYDVPVDGLVARKFSTLTNAYFTLSGVTFENKTINGHAVTVVTYQITDNSALDMNPEVGSIADPVGVGVTTLGAPRTGGGGTAGRPLISDLSFL